MNPNFDAAVGGLFAADPLRDYIVISHPITRELHSALSDRLDAIQTKPSATVFLTTYGGDPDGGYRIARCLRHHYKQGLRVAVASWCKSAGTLIAIGADELAIGDRGELGPLDVQVYKGSELMERSSGLDITEALGLVSQHVRWGYHSMLREARRLGLSTKLAADMAAHIGAAIAQPLLNQLDPLRLGELQRAIRIASDYGERLDAYSRNLKDGALQSLINDFPSHSFVIDRKEAANWFKRVSPLTPAEDLFVKAIWPHIAEQNELVEIVDLSKVATTTPGEDHAHAERNDDAVPQDDAAPPEGGGDPEASGASVPIRASVNRGKTQGAAGNARLRSAPQSSAAEPVKLDDDAAA